MSIWASYSQEDMVRGVEYEHSGPWPRERHPAVWLDFAAISPEVAKEQRLQRWLRVTVVPSEGNGLEFCLNVKEAKRLAAVLAQFIERDTPSPSEQQRGD